MHSRQTPLINALLVGASLLIACLLLEIGLRAASVVNNGSFYTADLDRGWGLRPGAEGWSLDERKVYIRINSDGLRDREHAIYKPSNTLRIAVLGDSYAEAAHVPIEEAFWSVLEREMSRCPALGPRKVEVINFGVSGYGTAQELLTLHRHVWRYSPDIVLLAFYTGNDIFNNYRTLNPTDVEQTPYFVYARDQLVLDDSFRKSWKFSKAYRWFFDFRGNLQNRSRLVQVLMKAVTHYKKRSAQEAAGHNSATPDLSDPEHLIYTPPTDDGMKEAWRVTEGLLLLMRDEVRAHGAELWVATLANRIQVHPDPGYRRALMNRLGIDTLLYPDLRLRAFAEREKIPIITLAIPLAAYAEARRVFLNGGENISLGGGHWNKTGHRIAGEIIASQLCSGSARLSRPTDEMVLSRK